MKDYKEKIRSINETNNALEKINDLIIILDSHNKRYVDENNKVVGINKINKVLNVTFDYKKWTGNDYVIRTLTVSTEDFMNDVVFALNMVTENYKNILEERLEKLLK